MELAQRCMRLVAVELDAELFVELRTRVSLAPHVEAVHGDFLQIPLPSCPNKIFGNIPYNRTASIIRKLTGSASPPQDAYLVVQREAGQRFAGAPFGPESLTSLLLKPWWQIEIVRRLKRTDFDPPPRVDSIVLWLARRTRPLVDRRDQRLYVDFVGASFGRAGNTVRRCMSNVFTGRQINTLARDLRFDPQDTPSALAFDQWLGLFRFLMLINSR